MHFWITYPISKMIRWQLTDTFVHDLLNGKMLKQTDSTGKDMDRLFVNEWSDKEASEKKELDFYLSLYAHARLLRFFHVFKSSKKGAAETEKRPRNSIIR